MASQEKNFVDVILPLSLPNTFTYHLPEQIEVLPEPGMRVVVQFGKQKLYTALVVKVHQTPPADYETKPITDLLDDTPIVYEYQLDFWRWIANYYMCHPGDVYQAALPSGLKIESETRIFANDLPEEGIELPENELLLLQAIEANPGISVRKLASSSGKKNPMPLIKRMLDRQIISLEQKLRESYKPKTVDYIVLSEKWQSEKGLKHVMDKLERRAPKQSNLLLAYLEMCGYLKDKSYHEVRKPDLMKRTGISSSILKSMIDKAIFISGQIEISRLDDGKKTAEGEILLNEKQEKARKEIVEQFDEKDVVLLHGVTSSGKTEIYIQLIKEQIKKRKQVLYLLPEIALTTQIITRLKKVFGSQVGVYHSKFSDSERVEVWRNLLGEQIDQSESYQLILGVRSSLFLPFRDLGLIIVDEEHENTYKQFDPAPRYNARDASVVLAAMHKAKVLMGTATPSLESYYNVKTGKYGLVELFDRYLDIKLPKIEVVDIREARRKKQMKHAYFSPRLVALMEETLENKQQVILFQNRRGFSPYVECYDCGTVPQCQHCDVSMTYHKYGNRLVCHYCGFSYPNQNKCKACGSTSMHTKGFGTEKVEDDISILFPGAKVARMDLDSTRSKKSYEKIIGGFEDGEIDILIGTQMVSKGLDFGNVRLVGILNADNMLNFPDFRSYERSYQLMAQVSGRAGRKKGQGIVVIQTSDGSNKIIEYVKENNFKSMYHEQVQERQLFLYPPANRLIRLTLRHKKNDIVRQASKKLAYQLRSKLGERVVGPEAPLISRVFNWHQQCILIKLPKDKNTARLKQFIQDSFANLIALPGFKSVQMMADVDPY